jgi:hypothetical protein
VSGPRRSGSRNVGTQVALREVNTVRDWLYGNMVGERVRFLKFNELAICVRYEQMSAVSGCGFKNFLPPDTTVNESLHDNSPFRRMVKGRIWAVRRV